MVAEPRVVPLEAWIERLKESVGLIRPATLLVSSNLDVTTANASAWSPDPCIVAVTVLGAVAVTARALPPVLFEPMQLTAVVPSPLRPPAQSGVSPGIWSWFSATLEPNFRYSPLSDDSASATTRP